MSDNNEKLINDIQNLRNLITDMQENEFTEDFESIFNSNFDTLKEELSQLDYEKTQLKYTSEDKELLYLVSVLTKMIQKSKD
jgi:NAD-dependent DNA ligase